MRTRSNAWLMTLVFVTTVTSVMANGLLAPLIPDITDHFGQPRSSGPLLIAATSLPGVIVAPTVGLLADRFGRRNVLTPCLAIFGMAGLAAAAAPTFGLMLLFRFLMGFGAAGLINLAITLIGDRFGGEERTRWVGINAGILTIGLAILPMLAGGLTELAGWREALSIYGFGLVGAVLAWWVLPSRVERDVVPLRQQLSEARGVLKRTPILLNFLGSFIVFGIIFGVFLGTVPDLLDSTFGLSSGWRGVVLGVPAIASSIAAFNLRRLQRLISPPVLLIVTAVVWAIAFVLMGLAVSLLVLVMGGLLYGFGEGAMIPTMQTAALADAPEAHRAVVLATWTAAARLGQTVGPVAAGIIISQSNTEVAILAGSLGSVALLVLFIVAGRVGGNHRHALSGPDAIATDVT